MNSKKNSWKDKNIRDEKYKMKQNIVELIEHIKTSYDDPEKAVKVFRQYQADFIPSNYEILRQMVFDASNSSRLDVLLDQALTRLNQSLQIVPFWEED